MLCSNEADVADTVSHDRLTGWPGEGRDAGTVKDLI